MIDLQRIEANNYHLNEGEIMWDYVNLMLQYIGDPQSELRDELIYPTFYKWIIEQQQFSEVELRSILSVLLDEQHLFYHIGSEGDSTVFTRTFTVLVVTLILQRHILQPFLVQTEFSHVKNSLLRYYQEEKDLRGYLTEGGWAHGAAHGADALEELVKCKESDPAVQLEVLAVVKGMLYNGWYMFSDEEDERIASIVDTILFLQLLPHPIMVEWIGQLGDCCSWPRSRRQYITRVNTKNCMRSLYFRCVHNNEASVYIDPILKLERKLNKFAQ
ncbi:DUF2785 domain-containing protein [Paenibacillus wynnii]|uniref:DUF2785 domain-containing protein n=1 Tax=Paenibacillus wynnii TaxID=268407 RepID=UPI0035931172